MLGMKVLLICRCGGIDQMVLTIPRFLKDQNVPITMMSLGWIVVIYLVFIHIYLIVKKQKEEVSNAS